MSPEVINVFIPNGPHAPRVQSDFSTGSGGETVIWQVFNANEDVHQVEIAFSEHLHYFDSPQKSSFRKAVAPGTCAIIHGKVPLEPGAVKNASYAVRSDKYDIIGLSGNGTRVPKVLLDPEIIVKVP